MKGVYKKCFVFLLLSVPLALSLLISSDTSALKYAYNAFPLFTNIFVDNANNSSYISRSSVGSGFSSSFLSDTSNSLSFDPDLLNSEATFEFCDDSYSNHIFSKSGGINPSRSSLLPSIYFRKVAESRNSVSLDNCLGHSPSYPLRRWSYDSIYSVSYNLSDGSPTKLVDVPNLYFDFEQDGYDEGSLYSMSVPLTLSDNFKKIPSGTLLEWDFGLTQSTANGFSYLSPDLEAVFDFSYFTADPDTSSFDTFYNSYRSTLSTDNPLTRPVCTIDRDYRFFTKDPEMWEQFRGFNVHCSYTAPSDLYYFSPILFLHSTVANDPILNYDYEHFYLGASYLVTNGDPTWSGEYANPEPTGDNLTEAPGYHQLYGYPDQPHGCVEGDWVCNLGNLFNFNFINPFAPIFALFTSSNDCVSIPTIAGMIHSEETTVCPWFDSTTRSIATPVLGISSMMLIFGFAVHWLRSSSGNLFEDTDSHDAGSISIGKRGRR